MDVLGFNKDNIPPELAQIDAELLEEITGMNKSKYRHAVGLRKKDKSKPGMQKRQRE